MFDKIKNLFNQSNNKYLGTYKGVPIYDDKEYKIIYSGLFIRYTGDDLAMFLRIMPSMFENVERVETVKWLVF